MNILDRITNYRFTAFLVVNAVTVLLSLTDKLESFHTQLVLCAAIVAFIAAQAWESVVETENRV